MKIIVVSDTHMPRSSRQLPNRLVQELRTADLILHAGDWTSEEVYEELARYAPVEGVAGNNDGEAVASRFGCRKKLQLPGGVTIGLVHGHGAKAGLTAEQTAGHSFAPGEADLIVFGHSHIPVLKRQGGRLLFNPGSPTDKRREKQYSFGILDIEGRKIEARHVFYDSKE
jgi:putative phosphoesterase